MYQAVQRFIFYAAKGGGDIRHTEKYQDVHEIYCMKCILKSSFPFSRFIIIMFKQSLATTWRREVYVILTYFSPRQVQGPPS